nr:hypothetical protein [Duganella guangzhouensis]
MSGASRAADSKRILANLEHGPRPAASPKRSAGWTIDGWTIGLCVLLILMCSVAWMMHDRRITPDTFRHGYSSDSTTARKTATPSMHANDAVPDEQAAAIINVTPPATGDDDVEEARVPHSAPDAMSAAPSTVPATSAAVPPRTTTTAQHKPAPRAPSAPSAQDRPATPANGDTDVTLLTALVAHANKPAAVTPERSRDIVERQEGDNTAQLLTRCKQLGMIEGMLCRSRICSGRWENDTACRAPAH